jgi:hypothetical protein
MVQLIGFTIRIYKCFSLYIMLSMILQLGGLGTVYDGISTALSGGGVDAQSKKGKFDFWYQ